MSSIDVEFQLQPGLSPPPRIGFVRFDAKVFDFDGNTFVLDASNPSGKGSVMAESTTFPGVYRCSFATDEHLDQFTAGRYVFVAMLDDLTVLAIADDFVSAGSNNIPPSVATFTSDQITALAAAISALATVGLTSGALAAIATRLLDTEQAGGDSIRKLLRAVAAAVAAARITQPSDGSTTALSDWADGNTNRINSANSTTGRTNTIAP